MAQRKEQQMRIKHWQGYGCVNAKKLRKDSETLVVEVSGMHEYGLTRNDAYDVFNWLVKRFDKSRKDYREIRDIDIDEDSETVNGLPFWRCVYTISFRKTY